VDQRIKDNAHARREGMRSRTVKARLTPVRASASLRGRDALHQYRCAPMKDPKMRIITFSIAILVSLVAWGGFAYLAMHFLKK
jgi:hypothetical protein